MAGRLDELWKIGSDQPTQDDLVVGGLAIDTVGKRAYSKATNGDIFSIGSTEVGHYLPLDGSGTMTGNVKLASNKAITGVGDEILIKMQSDDSTVQVGNVQGPMSLRGQSFGFEGSIPTTNVAQGNLANEFTRKDYADKKLAMSGGTMTGTITSTNILPLVFKQEQNIVTRLRWRSEADLDQLSVERTTNNEMQIKTYLNVGTLASTTLVKRDGNVQVNAGTVPAHEDDLTNKKYVDSKVGVGGITPIGGIIMWAGDSIPDGWALCNGSNDTPNLVGRFVRAGDLGTTGETGGSNDSMVIEHKHYFTGDSLPTHSHTVSTHDHVNGSGYVDGTGWGGVLSNKTTSKVSAGTPSGDISTAGVTGINRNLPAYYTLMYIQRKS